MKKVIATLLVTATMLLASNGQEIYEKKCQACHMLKPPAGEMDMSKMDRSKMKAPPMKMVSMRLKSEFKTQKAFVAFVNDYIQHPAKDKGLCMPRAFKDFGVMPPVGLGMNDTDRVTVSTWLYTNFKGSMKDMKNGKSCSTNKAKASKCGAGKCGSSMKKEKKSAMKCGAGKCGSN